MRPLHAQVTRIYFSNMEGIEKRKSRRIVVELVSVEVYLSSSSRAELEIREICPIRNISESGMLFEAESRFNPGDRIRLTFALPDSPIAIRTDAIVIHATKKNKCYVGVQFNNLAIAEQKLLRHFVNVMSLPGSHAKVPPRFS